MVAKLAGMGRLKSRKMIYKLGSVMMICYKLDKNGDLLQ